MKLYGRLLSWFLLATIVTLAAALLIGEGLRQALYTDSAALADARRAVAEYERGGTERLRSWLRERRDDGVVGELLDAQGRPLSRPGPPPPPGHGHGHGDEPPHFGPPPWAMEPGNEPPDFEPRSRGDARRGERRMQGPPGPEPMLLARRQDVSLIASDGQTYRWIGVMRAPRGGVLIWLEPLLRIGAGVLVMAGIALIAARRLSRPIRALEVASRATDADGLPSAVPTDLLERRDEIGALGRAFRDMTTRLAGVIGSQRQLLRDVSHELRSPLARLHVALELAREQPRAEYLDRIEQEAERLEDLIAQTLLVARLQDRSVENVTEQIDLAELLRDICSDAEFEGSTADVHVELRAPDVLMVTATPFLLRAACENVVRNALQHTARGTTIDVQLEPGDVEHCITVCDRGPGMPPERLDDVFLPFVRLSQAREPDHEGYGLGLAIAANAMRVQGGRLSARNRDGGGLCLEFRLPAAAKS